MSHSFNKPYKLDNLLSSITVFGSYIYAIFGILSSIVTLDPFGKLLPQTCLRDQVHKRVQKEGGTGDGMLHALLKGVAGWWYQGDKGFQNHLCKTLMFSWYPCGIRAEVPRISWYPLVHL